MISTRRLPATCASQPVLRLAHVRQTGFLYLVWPSATHTRLAHSLGTMHLAEEYLRRLRDHHSGVDGEALTPARGTVALAFVAAALLHDVGHGPFSHTFESALPSYDHDSYRYRLLEEAELASALQRDGVSPDDVRHIWAGTGTPQHLAFHTLLAGMAGVDRFEYVLTDLSVIRPQKTIDVTLIQSIMQETRLETAADGAWTGRVLYTVKGAGFVEAFLQERIYLYRDVYAHPRSLAAEMLLHRAFESGLAVACRRLLDAGGFHALTDDYILAYGNVCDPVREAVAVAALERLRDGDVPHLQRHVGVPRRGDVVEATFSKCGVTADDLDPQRVGLVELDGSVGALSFQGRIPDAVLWFSAPSH